MSLIGVLSDMEFPVKLWIYGTLAFYYAMKHIGMYEAV